MLLVRKGSDMLAFPQHVLAWVVGGTQVMAVVITEQYRNLWHGVKATWLFIAVVLLLMSIIALIVSALVWCLKVGKGRDGAVTGFLPLPPCVQTVSSSVHAGCSPLHMLAAG